MKIEKEMLGDVLYLKLTTPTLDITVSNEFKSQVIENIGSGKERLLLDLSEIETIDSSGLSALIGIYKALEDKNNLHIYGLKKKVITLFEITGLVKLFHFYSSKDEACKF